jgi:hypothetical protein
MRGAIPPLPQYAFMAQCLVKHRDNFAFYIPKDLDLNLHRRETGGCISPYCSPLKMNKLCEKFDIFGPTVNDKTYRRLS